MNRWMQLAGFKSESELKSKKICPMCGIHVGYFKFKDAKAIERYNESGYCQPCQDAIWKGE